MTFTKGAPLEESKLLPSVFAMSGKTEMVSRAGNMTTILDAAFNMVSVKFDTSSACKPKVKFEKLRLTLDSVLEPK